MRTSDTSDYFEGVVLTEVRRARDGALLCRERLGPAEVRVGLALEALGRRFEVVAVQPSTADADRVYVSELLEAGHGGD